MVRVGWWLSAIMVGCLALRAPHAIAQTATGSELRKIYGQLLLNPTDLNLNFRYAQAAIKEGRLRSALAAYQRILASNPENEKAKAGILRIQRLLEPGFTEATLVAGAQYETNPRYVPDGSTVKSDFAGLTYGSVIDERKWGETRFRTEAKFYADFHGRFSDLNFGNVSLDTGPFIDVAPDLRVRPTIGVEYAWLDSRTFYREAATSLGFMLDNFAPFKSIEVRFAYQDIGRSFSARDAFEVRARLTFQFPNVMFHGDSVRFRPYARYNGLFGSGAPGLLPSNEQFPLESHAVGADASYVVRIGRSVVGVIGLTGEDKNFAQRVFLGSQHREDVFIAGRIQLVVRGIGWKNHDLIFQYQAIHNASNDNFEEYTNHIIGIQSAWRF